jgi:CRP-like cAMP-binding protein
MDYVLVRKLQEHSELSGADVAAIQSLPDTPRRLNPAEDVVRQGDKPKVSVVVLSGMVARYHTLRGGGRQYLSFHIVGDMPDAQALFLESMDHALCAVEEAVVSLISHAALLALFRARPSIGYAVWRETLIDASIFREAITNIGSRSLQTRLLHFFCEQYYRARAAELERPGICRLSLTQTQIGEALGASLPSVSRAFQAIRRTQSMDLKGGLLYVYNWKKMVDLGDFSPGYLHLKTSPQL